MRIAVLLIIVLFNHSAAQDSTVFKEDYYPFIVDSIQIIGNETTEEYIITRELNFSPGDSLFYEDILFNRDRIFSLGIFTRVDLYTKKTAQKNILVIDVEESWYIYPLPILELKDKDWDKLSYGAYVYVKNFRGRNETIGISAAFGYDPSFHITYTVPSLTDDGNYYFFTDLYYRVIRNKSQLALSLSGDDFDQKMLYGIVGLGRRFGLFHRLSVSAGYTTIENPFYIPVISASTDRTDRFPTIGLNYIYDTRDLAQFPTNGTLLNTDFTFKGLGINDINYQILTVDYRKYISVAGNLFAKWRMAGRFGFGKLIPTHDYSYLGFGERIRGFYSIESEGNHLYLTSAELFYPLVKEFQVKLDFIPLLPRELLHYRAGLYLQLFTDAGTTKFKNTRIGLADFKSGYGIGLTLLILPYNIVRAEYAISESGLTEFIFDLGISF